LTSFFSILPVYDFHKNFKIFVLFHCMDPRFYQKILQNYSFFFQKKLRYLKSNISTKFNRLLFFFYFISIFGILFSISPIQTCPNIMKFFEDFANDFWKILKVLFKTIMICEIFFSKFCGLLFVFFFVSFWTFYFQFRLSVLVKKF